jgi:hypothetical protein
MFLDFPEVFLHLRDILVALLYVVYRRTERLNHGDIEHHTVIAATAWLQDALVNVVADGLRIDSVNVSDLASGQEHTLLVGFHSLNGDYRLIAVYITHCFLSDFLFRRTAVSELSIDVILTDSDFV